MSEFRKFGFFGESPGSCEYINQGIAPEWTGMEMFNLQTNQRTNFGFPLDLAMKIFWEAQSFTIRTSVIVDNTSVGEICCGCPPGNYTTTDTFQWGSIPLQLNAVPYTKALDIVCRPGVSVVFDGVFDQELDVFQCDAPPFSEGGFDPPPFQGSADYRTVFGMPSVPFAANSMVHASFFVTHEIFRSGGNAFVRASPLRITNLLSYENSNGCLWITPWGNATSPLYGYINAASASMTITVTAADPAIRYATE
jgi:hypothetical protein